MITGGSRGIGKAITEKFSRCGYKVFAPTRKELDLNDDDSVTSFIERYKDTFFDVLINNAGCNDINLIEDVTDKNINEMMTVNLVSPTKLIRGLVGQMKKSNYGRIVNIGSIWCVVSKEGRAIYSATKHAIHGVTTTTAIELAPYNILVNTVCPGYTLTELTKKNNTDDSIAKICKSIPLGRMAEPIEIAETVYFLGSDSNTYLTGQKIVVDGGFTII